MVKSLSVLVWSLVLLPFSAGPLAVAANGQQHMAANSPKAAAAEAPKPAVADGPQVVAHPHNILRRHGTKQIVLADGHAFLGSYGGFS